jgi:hypothetical protein
LTLPFLALPAAIEDELGRLLLDTKDELGDIYPLLCFEPHNPLVNQLQSVVEKSPLVVG